MVEGRNEVLFVAGVAVGVEPVVLRSAGLWTGARLGR